MYIKFKRNLITIIGKTKQRQFFKRITGSLLSVVLLWSNLFIIPFSVSDVSVLYCGLEEHVHTEQCYDDDLALVCGLEEHTHTEECYTEPVKSSKSWLQELLNPSGASVETERSANTNVVIYFASKEADWKTDSKYKLYANVNRKGDGDDWKQVEMTKTNYTFTYDSVTYYVYKATVELLYGGAGEIQFQTYYNQDWKSQVVAVTATKWETADFFEGKIFVKELPEYSFVDYTEGETPVFTKNVYYDATLSKLSYNGSSSYGEAAIPRASGNNEVNTVVCHWWKGSGNNASGDVTMTKLDSHTSGNNTWSDVYRADIPEGAEKVIFYGGTWTNFSDRTDGLTIPTELTNPCYYGNTSDHVIYHNSDANKRGGYWNQLYTIHDGGDPVDISTGSFSRDSTKLYLNTTLYDYYSDYELNVNADGTSFNRDQYSNSENTPINSHRIYQQFRQFNQALSFYYDDAKAASPLYWGNFQNFNGSHFDEISDTLNLYGYTKSAGSEKYKFFAENNSMWGFNGVNVGNDGEQATQGLVSDTLDQNGNLMIKTNSNYVQAPFFNESFLKGNNSKNSVLGKIYNNVSFPFTKSPLRSKSSTSATGTVDYWVFDSRNTNLQLKNDSTNGYYLAETNETVKGATTTGITEKGNFFPFNTTTQSGIAQKLNYGFATKLEFTFRLTSDGMVNDSTHTPVPIEFNFSGDDDVWVFIDGNLALDVGGGHGRVEGTINFGGSGSEKSSTVQRVKIRNSSTGGTETDKVSNFSLKGSNTDEHTLTMFYMERGLWESNLEITFNFPDENQIEVEKQVDTSQVNDKFKNLFDGKDIFTFDIKTLATHYGAFVASGSDAQEVSVPLENNNGASLTSADSEVEFKNYIEPNHDYVGSDASKVIRWKSEKDDADSSHRSMHYGQIELDNAIALIDKQYIQFDFLFNCSGTPSLQNLFIDLLDENKNTLLTAENMSVSGCVSGSPTMAQNQWITLKLNLEKMLLNTSYDKSVKYIRIGYDLGRNVYIRNMSFLPSAKVTEEVGFTTSQKDIPDYNSSKTGQLEIPKNAVYTSSLGNTSRIGSDGTFTLQNGEKVTFHDQFRLGSYMYIAEEANSLFTTKWSMYEDNKAVASFSAGSTIVNPTTIPSMTNVSTSMYVDDGRTEVYQAGTEQNPIANTGYTETKRVDNTFVFRSYSDPDKTATATKLKVVFTNTVNTGILTIGKKQPDGSTLTNEEFEFVVEFSNVGGLNLEGNTPVVESFKLKVGGEHTITGIPLNTQYFIYELKRSEADVSLDHVQIGDNKVDHISTYYREGEENKLAYLYSGTITSASSVSVDFYNQKKAVTSLELKKLWYESNGSSDPTALDDGQTPSSIKVQLQRSTNGTDWTAVDDYKDVTISHNYTEWENFTYKFEGLDKYYDLNSNEYKYRVVELDASGNVVNENTNFTLSGSNYTVGTYTTSTEGTGNSKKFTQTITNTLNPVVKIIVTKQWKDSNNTVLTGDDIPSANVTVQLQRKTNSTSWSAVTDNSYNNVSLPNGNSWTYTFENLPKYTGSTEYQYRVVELDGSSNPIVENGTVTVNGTSYKVTYSSLDVAGTNTYTQKIFNTEDSKIKISVTKVWQNSSGGTLSQTPASVNVRIRRKVGSGEWENVGEAQTLNSGNSWTYTSGDLPKKNGSNADYTYDVVEVGESGREITIGSTKYTVTYSNAINASDSNQTDWTITNKAVPTVSLAITKQSASDSNIKLQNVKFTLEKQDESGNSWYFVNDNIETGTDGKASVTGLLPGTYRLTEIKTAEGYSLLKAPIEIVIVNNSGTYSATVDNSTVEMNKSEDVYTLQLTVYNKQKFLLPATGGVNGFEFWILGGLCVIAVPLLLYAFTVYKKGGRKA